MKISPLRTGLIFVSILLVSFTATAAEQETAWEAADLEARSALDRGDVAGARRSAEDAARIAENAFGPSQMKTAVAFRRLAEIERLAGDTVRSAKTMERAAAIWKGALGKQSPYVADLKLQAAQDREAAGDLAGAEAAYREVVQIRKTYFGPKHTAVADTLQKLSQIERKAGRYDAARQDESEAAEILFGALEPGHPRTLSAFESLAAHAIERGDRTAARRDLKRVLASADAAPHPNLKALARTWTLDADLAAQDNDPVRAEESYARALSLLEQAGDPDRSEHLSVLYKLREFYQAAGREDAAVQIDERARKLDAGSGLNPSAPKASQDNG